ncbi:SDR family NAD(P)-dependent oxidoreductase [Catellatospora coxensis]
MTEHGPYHGKVAVVTGGAGGIGAACASRLARGGAHVVVADIDTERGSAVAARIGGEFVAADVTRLADNTALFDTAAARFGRLDVVHLNAGIIGGTAPATASTSTATATSSPPIWTRWSSASRRPCRTCAPPPARSS